MKRAKLSNKLIIFIVLITMAIFTMGASSWLIITENQGTPSIGIIESQPTVITPEVSLSTTAIYETEKLTAKSDVPGTFYYGTTALGSIIDSTVNKDVGISPPIDVSGTADEIPIAVTFVVDEDYLTNNNYQLSSTEPISFEAKLKAVAYIGGATGTKYSSIQSAITACGSTAKDVVVITGTNMNVTRAITVPTNVNLVLPFYDSLYTQMETANSGSYISCNYGSGYKYTIGRTESGANTTAIEQLHAKTTTGSNLYDYTDGNATKVAKYRKILITMKNGADITVQGTLSLGGEYGLNSMKGRYAQINLDAGSSIVVSGSFYCEGFVKEINAKNGNQSSYSANYNNNFDSGRLIHVTSTGFLQTGLALYDMKSGGPLTSLIENDVFAINKFDFPYMQTYVQIDNGGKFHTFSHAFVSIAGTDQQVNKLAPILEPESSGTTAVFYLSGGNASFEYCPSDVAYTTSSSKTRIFLNGALSLGSMTLEVDAGIRKYVITTENNFTPLSHKFAVFVNDGGSFTMGDKVKLMPGSLLQINKGGNFNINSEFAIYKGEHGKYAEGYGTGYADAQFINNGTVTVSSSGKIGGFIQTTATDNSAILDFSATTSSEAFTVTSNEWSDITYDVKIISEGYFEDDTDEGVNLYQFVVGSTVNSASSGTKVWSGEKLATQSLTVSLATVSFTNKVYAYQIFTSATGNDSDQSELTSITQDIKSYVVPRYQYVKVVTSRCETATINGETLSTTKWYEITDDISIVITPLEGVAIKIRTDGTSGNGKTTYTVWESSTQTGTYTEVATQGTGPDGVNFYVAKNYWFKITCDGEGASLVKTGTIESGPTTGSVSKYASNRLSSAKAFQATATYTIYFPRTDVCLAEGAMITLADGTQKPVEQLTYADEILVFNHETGKIEKGNIATLDHLDLERAWYDVINLKFSNGNILRTVWNHGLYNVTLNRYVFIHEGNYKDYIGDEFYSVKYVNGDFANEIVKLTESYITNEFIKVYNPTTAVHMNYFASGMLNVTALPNEYLDCWHVNIFEYDENMKIDEEKKQADIEKYGLYTYEDFKEYLTEEQFNVLPFNYLKVAVGKGRLTWEDIIDLINYLKDNGLM